MEQKDKLILETLRWILFAKEDKRLLGEEDYKIRDNLVVGIDELLNPKSQEKPFKKTLEEKE